MAASYPTSVKSFTTKNPDELIPAPHINDLQDEVAAIEAGLLNGTAPLNSSRSTFAGLSVTGPSTVTSLQAGPTTVASLHVTGASTFGGGQTFGASTFGSLSVTGGSTVTTLQAGASTVTTLQAGASTVGSLTVSGGSTLASLSVSGNSTVAALQAGASTLGSLTVTSNVIFMNGFDAGASTLGALNVAGVSTLASLQVTNNCTIGGNLVVTGTITGALVSSYLKAYLASAQALTSTGLITLALAAEVEDKASEYSTATYTFTPKSSGYYAITARAAVGASSDGGVALGLYVNSTLAAQDQDGGAGARPARTAQVSALLNLSSGTAGSVTVRAQCPGSSNVTVSTGVALTTLEILRVF